MKVENIETTNQQSKKFILAGTISSAEKTYADNTEALQSPVAAKIFGFPWTDKVTVGANFVEITKQDWVDWDVLEQPLKGLIEEHFQAQQGEIEENPQAPAGHGKNLDSTEAKAISQLIEEQINPALASHGGYVVLHSVENNQVFLEMGGGCQGCAMSYQTMKEGIEGAIKEIVPSITQVVDVTNHSQGDNPYFS